MNKNLALFVIALLVLIGGYYLVKGTKTQPATSPTPVMEEQFEVEESPDREVMEEEEDEEEDADEAMEEETGVKSFNLDAVNYSFSQKEIRVKKGTTVKINLTRKQGFHDLVIEGYNARAKQLAEGQTDSVEFIADQTGTFEYYCSVGQHRQLGMVGKLIVE